LGDGEIIPAGSGFHFRFGGVAFTEIECASPGLTSCGKRIAKNPENREFAEIL